MSATSWWNAHHAPHEVIIVATDDAAARVAELLEPHGFVVLRQLDDGEGPHRLRWAVRRMWTRYKLSPREQDVLERILAGRTKPEIADDLEIGQDTVKFHMSRIYTKTGVKSREGLLRLALQLDAGALPPGDDSP